MDIEFLTQNKPDSPEDVDNQNPSQDEFVQCLEITESHNLIYHFQGIASAKVVQPKLSNAFHLVSKILLGLLEGPTNQAASPWSAQGREHLEEIQLIKSK